jgi:hypothetical protein
MRRRCGELRRSARNGTRFTWNFSVSQVSELRGRRWGQGVAGSNPVSPTGEVAVYAGRRPLSRSRGRSRSKINKARLNIFPT